MAKKVNPKEQPQQSASPEPDHSVKPKAVITSATESGTMTTRVKTTRELYMES